MQLPGCRGQAEGGGQDKENLHATTNTDMICLLAELGNTFRSTEKNRNQKYFQTYSN